MKRAILHIGTEKTGTTSLQHLLAHSRTRLRDGGVVFPRSAGPKNHTRLVAASIDIGVVDNIKAHIMADRSEDEVTLQKSFRDDFRRELVEGSPWHTLLISSELIHSRLHTKTEIDRLFSYFRDLVDDVHIVVVLRRQDKLAVSRFSTALRAGHVGTDDVFHDLHRHAYFKVPPSRHICDFEHYYDYLALVRRFDGHVRPENLHIWHYEVGGKKIDIASQLENLLTVRFDRLDVDTELNIAMSLTAQHLVANLNAEFPQLLRSGLRNNTFVNLKNRISFEVNGPPRQVNRADAEAFMVNFKASNKAVADRIQSDHLFDDDFSIYPAKGQNALPEDFTAILDRYRNQFIAETQPNFIERLKSLINMR